MSVPKCEFCGGEYGSSVGDRIFVRTMTFGLIGNPKNPYRPFCSRDCRVAHQQQAGAAASQQKVAALQREEAAQRQANEDQTAKAQSFHELVVGRDVSSWEGSCDRCSRVLIHPATSDYCDKCGSQRNLELRLYGDGFKRIVCHCRACGWDPVLHGIPCECGGEARIGNVVVRNFANPRKTGPSDPIIESTDVVFSSPRNITADDLKIDVAAEGSKKNGSGSGSPTFLKWIGYLLLFALLAPHTTKLWTENSLIQMLVVVLSIWAFVKFLHGLKSRGLRWLIFVGTLFFLFILYPVSTESSEVDGDESSEISD